MRILGATSTFTQLHSRASRRALQFLDVPLTSIIAPRHAVPAVASMSMNLASITTAPMALSCMTMSTTLRNNNNYNIKLQSTIPILISAFSATETELTINNTTIKTTADKNNNIICRRFTTAYQGQPSDGTHNAHLLDHLLPHKSTLSDGRRVEIDYFHQDEWYAGMALMNLIIREGKSWPFQEEFQTIDDYRGYFLSHAAFVVRALNNGMDASRRNSSSQGEILGCFYIKPNFPGRCSHICNGGFITAPRFRGLGVGELMGKVFLRAARDLGYKSSYFNLVFQSNESSVRLWERLGFQRVAVLEKAARLEGMKEGELDTAYGYRYDLELLPEEYLGVKAALHRRKDGNE